MFDSYLNEDEFCKKYSPYQQGQTVTIIKPIYCDNGKYVVGTEFVITDVKLDYGISLPKVLSSEADIFYADEKMFVYTAHPKGCDDDSYFLSIRYLKKMQRKQLFLSMIFVSITAAFLIGLIITMWNSDGVHALDCTYGLIISAVITKFLCFREPMIHKKRKQK